MLYRCFLTIFLLTFLTLCNAAEETELDVNPTQSEMNQNQANQAQIAQGEAHKKFIIALTSLGKRIFNDKSLSASGKQSCASCHNTEYALSSPNALSVQLGGKRLNQQGTRAVPSLKYLQSTPLFTEHYMDDEGLHPGQDNGPSGGFTWDGRAETLASQARIPLFSKNEMATTPSKLAKKLATTDYKETFSHLFGVDILNHQDQLIEKALLALETYQQNGVEFYPYTSKYDDVLRHKDEFSEQEARGFQAFINPAKGNCASCHNATMVNGAFPQFTDYGYAALGLPRNTVIKTNDKKNYFDMGLCGPARTDLKDKNEYCGFFKVPSLRNVALKKTFYHNGLVKSLEQAVRFYAERDTKPQKWYPHDAKGNVLKFNDLPRSMHTNIEIGEPFGQKSGQTSPLKEQDIQDIVAFLKTLTDK